jgi:hypothetical protein
LKPVSTIRHARESGQPGSKNFEGLTDLSNIYLEQPSKYGVFFQNTWFTLFFIPIFWSILITSS